MDKFVLLLTLWGSEHPAPQVDVVDSNLTGEDCIAAMIELRPIEKHGYLLSCEFDDAQYEGEF